MWTSSKQGQDVTYLEIVEEFINANPKQKTIYESITSLTDVLFKTIKGALAKLYHVIDKAKQTETPPPLPPRSENLNAKNAPPLPPGSENLNVEVKPPLPPKKRKLNKVHTDSGIAVNGKDEKRVYTENISSREQTEVDHRYYILLDLGTDMQKLRNSFQKDHFPKKAIYVICNSFKEKVIRAIREQGDSESELSIESTHHYGNYSKITADSLTQIMAQVQEKKKEIKDLASNYKGEDNQLRQEISELLNVNLQKTDINSNYITKKPSEGQASSLSPRRYIKEVTQDKDTGSNTSERDKREKGKKTDLGSKILNYVPWRTALTFAAFAIPVVGPILGTVVGALAYGNYRKNNRTENEESSKESAKPSRLEKLSSEAGTIAKRIGVIIIGFLLGGPISGAIAIGLMAIDGISGGKLIQGAEKVLDAGYDALSWVKDKTLDAGKWLVDKMRSSKKGVEEKGKLIQSFDNPVYSHGIELNGDKKEVSSAKQPVEGSKVAAELRRRESSASQKQSAGIGSSR